MFQVAEALELARECPWVFTWTYFMGLALGLVVGGIVGACSGYFYRNPRS